MPTRSVIRLALAGLAISATAGLADEFQPYGSVEGWNVFVDVTKKSCLIETVDAAGNVVQMGLTNDRGVAYIGVFTKADTGIKQGDKEAVAILLGDKVFIGEATGMRGNITGGYSGGYVLTDDPSVVDAVAREHEMIVFPEKAYTFAVNLKGTYKAIEMARECNDKQLE
ncbi:hypothetical protein [Ruegeria marina]|uniref:Invasion protein IalB, involved in pathogenesis n=1 Tax=Ruegeria marina TaxID=639004 RepID=A0A1G6ZB76_9RHOB|nr:hypothetical protein [Ruegeria marina]SDD99553.1 hypothetical protein SAMN04488239_112141 [Ruegeria marina]